MTNREDERLQTIARIIELSNVRHGVPEHELEGTVTDAEKILALTNREDESKMELLNRILREEMNVRVRLNALQADRDILSEKCVTTLIELNALKREAYAMGFTGNIMRGADGERVNALQEKKAGE